MRLNAGADIAARTTGHAEILMTKKSLVLSTVSGCYDSRGGGEMYDEQLATLCSRVNGQPPAFGCVVEKGSGVMFVCRADELRATRRNNVHGARVRNEHQLPQPFSWPNLTAQRGWYVPLAHHRCTPSTG